MYSNIAGSIRLAEMIQAGLVLATPHIIDVSHGLYTTFFVNMLTTLLTPDHSHQADTFLPRLGATMKSVPAWVW